MPSRLKFLSYTHSKFYWTCENAVWGKVNKYGIIYKSEQLRMLSSRDNDLKNKDMN